MTFKATIAMLLSCSLAQAATIFVDNNGGCTLNDAIRSANDDNNRGDCTAGNGVDTIILPDNFNVTLTSSLTSISSPITIETSTSSGQAVIFSDGSSRIMRIANANNVTLRNLILGGGNLNAIGASGGAGVLITNSSVDLINVTVSSNTISGGTRIGAGLKIQNNSNVNIEQSIIKNNQIELEVLPIGSSLRGGNIAVIDSTVFIEKTTIEGCTNSFCAEKGSGVYIDNGEVTVVQSLLSYNENYDSSKGVDFYAVNNSHINLRNSTLFNDYNFRRGTRVYLEDSAMVMNNVTLYGDGSGDGGIETKNSTVSASNSLFYMRRTNSLVYDFCKAFDSNNNPIPFQLQSDINNLAPLDDTSCSINPIATGATSYGLITNIAEYGGPTKTSKLKNISYGFAINTGDPSTCETEDQRGFPRDSTCDIGAYELNESTDLSVDMHISTPAPYYNGQLIEYTTEVFNHGPSVAQEVEVYIDFSGLILDHFDSNHNCISSFFGYTCTIDTINNGGSAVILMYATKSATSSFDASAIVHNVALNSTDSDTSNNTDDVDNGGSVVDTADLFVSQSISTPGPYFIGQQVDYDIQVTNHGPSAATSAMLTNNVSGLNNITYAGCNATTTNTCTINFINNNGQKTITMTATINDNAISNRVSVSANEYDPDLLSNTTLNNNNVASKSDLKVSMSILTTAPYYPAGYVQYQISITNIGPDPATNVILTSFQGDNLTITDGDSTCNTLPCNIPVLMNGETKDIILGGTLGVPGGFDVNHKITVISDQNDDNQTNNEANSFIQVGYSADIETNVDLLDSAPYYEGTTVQYEVIVKNNGSTAASQVNIGVISTNLFIVGIESPNCLELPCELNNLEVGNNNQERILVNAFILNPGSFNFTAFAHAFEHDYLGPNNQETVGGVALEDPNYSDLIFTDGFE